MSAGSDLFTGRENVKKAKQMSVFSPSFLPLTLNLKAQLMFNYNSIVHENILLNSYLRKDD